MTKMEPFFFTEENLAKAKVIISKYPAGRQKSAVLPLLDLAQRQGANHITTSAMNYIADMLSLPEIRVYEVASFYSMFNLNPVGKYFIQICGTTPCMLRGSEAIVAACENFLNIKLGETTKDNLFTLKEVECLGACANSPMIQINDDYYEDLTPELTIALLSSLKEGRSVVAGSQTGRLCSSNDPKKYD